MHFRSRIAIVCVVLFGVAGVGCSRPAEGPAPEQPKERPISFYLERYPEIMDDWRRAFTIETELGIPVGYARPDSADLTLWQDWVQHIPLWHFNKGVSSPTRGFIASRDSISRAVRMPLRGGNISSAGIPIQLYAEYLLWRGQLDAFRWSPLAGDTVTYDRFLSSRLAFGPRGELRLRPDEPRPASSEELSRMVDAIAASMTFASLATHCESLERNPIAPGDLLIATDSAGKRGEVYVVLTRLEGRGKPPVLLLGTGCEFGCDFHIPLFGATRTEAWLTRDQAEQRVSTWDRWEWFRPRFNGLP